MSNQFIQAHRQLNFRYSRKFSNIEAMIAYLEADPYLFSSGYIKEYLIRVLCRIELKLKQAEQLRKVVLAIVEKRNTREFRWYCRLAYKLDSP